MIQISEKVWINTLNVRNITKMKNIYHIYMMDSTFYIIEEEKYIKNIENYLNLGIW